LAMEANHGLVEQRCGLGMLCKVIEQRRPMRFLKTGLSGLNGVDGLIPRTLNSVAAESKHGGLC
jgi:hypothetical protein